MNSSISPHSEKRLSTFQQGTLFFPSHPSQPSVPVIFDPGCYDIITKADMIDLSLLTSGSDEPTLMHPTTAETYQSETEIDSFILDVTESPSNTFVIRADIPGISMDDILIEAYGHDLEIRVKRPWIQRERMLHKERPAGDMVRVVHFDEEVDLEGARACYWNGVLTVELGKQKHRVVPVLRKYEEVKREEAMREGKEGKKHHGMADKIAEMLHVKKKGHESKDVQKQKYRAEIVYAKATTKKSGGGEVMVSREEIKYPAEIVYERVEKVIGRGGGSGGEVIESKETKSYPAEVVYQKMQLRQSQIGSGVSGGQSGALETKDSTRYPAEIVYDKMHRGLH